MADTTSRQFSAAEGSTRFQEGRTSGIVAAVVAILFACSGVTLAWTNPGGPAESAFADRQGNLISP